MLDWISPTVPAGDSLALLPLLLDAALKGVTLLAVAYLAVKLMWRASAASRHMVLFLAMSGLLALPVLSALLPQWEVLPRWFEAPGARADASVTSAEALGPSVANPPISVADLELAPPPVAHEQSVVGDDIAPMTVAVAPAVPTGELGERRPIRQLLNWVIPAWALGVMVTLMPLLLGALALRRQGRNATCITSGPWLSLLKELSGNLRLRRRVVLLQGDRDTMPLAWGIMRPRILLPGEADEWSAERRRVVLLHELAHIRHWDCVAQLIAHLACALHWFNPLAWAVRRRMISEREQACDDVVLSAGLKPSSYADHLLNIASGLRSGWASGSAAIAMARPSKLEGRLLAVLDTKRNRRALTRVAMVITIVLLSGIVLPLATMHAAELRNPVQTDENGKPIVTHVLYIWGQPNDPTFTLEERFYKKMADVIARIKQLMTADPFPYIRVRINPPIPSAQPLVEELGKQCREIGFINMEFKYDLTEPPPQIVKGSKTELPNGVTVELAGVSPHPSKGQRWWQPDGSTLAEAPYDQTGVKVDPGRGRQAFEFALRLDGLADRDIGLTLPGSSATARRENKSLRDVRAFVMSFPQARQRADVRIGIAGGPWKTLASSTGDGIQAGSTRGTAVPGEEYAVAFAGPIETAEQLVLTVSHTLATRKDYRIVLIDKAGATHKGSRNSASAGEFTQTTASFHGVPLDQVKEFQFQTRPYEWVEFKNVSLKPGHKTDVEVSVKRARVKPPLPTQPSGSARQPQHTPKKTAKAPTVREIAEGISAAYKAGDNNRMTALLGDNVLADTLSGYLKRLDSTECTIDSVHANDQIAQISSTPLTDNAGRQHIIRIILVNKNGRWQGRNVESWDARDYEDVVKNFLMRNPEAKRIPPATTGKAN